MQPTRRSFFKKLGCLPLVAALHPARLLGDSAALGEESVQRQRLAVQVLRLINTAELWHSLDYGNYLDIKELKDSQAISKLHGSEKAEKIRLGRSLIDALAFEEKEIVPGWELDQHLSEDREGYVITLSDKSESNLGTFSTDESGVISKVSPIGKQPDGKPTNAEQAPRSETNPRRMAGLLAALASLSGVTPSGTPPCCYIECCYCEQFPCCTDCECDCQTEHSGQCVNCGCQECVWCCDIF